MVFIVVSALAAYASRASLASWRAHGFYRFFAWELIIGLILLNFRGATQWFRDPLSARQLASWVLLSLSLLPLGLGVHLLRRLGQPDAQTRRDPRLFPIEQTTRLVTTGVFRYIRHPIYTSLLLLTWGVFLKHPSWVAAGLATVASLLLLATAVVEERENLQYWGPSYEVYRRETKRFIPLLF
jgi:protein-S-isoprenylcysteine O-methyltransferase Ste14